MKYLTAALLAVALSACGMPAEQTAAGVACQKFAEQAGHAGVVPAYTKGSPGGVWQVTLGRVTGNAPLVECETQLDAASGAWLLKKLG